MGYYTSFVIRIWSREDGRLHGSIEHVASRERLAFLDLAAVVDFIRMHLQPAQISIEGPNEEGRTGSDEPE